MSPKTSRSNLATSDGEEERHHRRHKGHKRHEGHKRQRPNRMEKKKKKRKTVGMKLEEEEANKSLYICSRDFNVGQRISYDIRAIKLSNLLSSSSSFDHPLQLQQVAYKAGSDLPGSVGCGVWGSKIVFAGGLKPSVPYGIGASRLGPVVWHRAVYCFETQQPEDEDKDKDKDNLIRKMDASFTLLQAKFSPYIVEVCGKLYALSYKLVADPPAFEVFDPKVGSWAALPQPPFFIRFSPYHRSASFSFALAGTKMFVSHDKCPVFCFDVAHPHREWRPVPTMCRGGPFPFVDRSLVLDLPDDKKKIMFAYSHDRYWRLGVYLMSLVENAESITRVGNVRLPPLPLELGYAKRCLFVHIGGRKACLVVTQLGLPNEVPQPYKPGTHKTWGVAIPFQFEVDMTKVDNGKEDCFTLQFMPPCVLNYHTNPFTFPNPETAGCFVL